MYWNSVLFIQCENTLEVHGGMLKAKIHVKAGLYPIDFVLNKLQSNISSVVDSLSSLTVPQITSQL